MKKVHVSLVGAQPLPVYHGIVNSKADIVYLLHSNDTEKIAKNISSLWARGVNLILVREPFEYEMCKLMIEYLVKEFPESEFSF